MAPRTGRRTARLGFGNAFASSDCDPEADPVEHNSLPQVARRIVFVLPELDGERAPY